MPTLVIVSPDNRRRRIELTDRRIQIGRADHCDIVLDDAEVSREHAEVWTDGQGRVLVRDKGSKNGTRVDDGEVFRGATRYAWRGIRIGEHAIEIVEAAPPDRPQRQGVTFAPDPPSSTGDTQFFPSSRGLDLSRQRLELLIRLTERIGGVFERKQLLEQALDACCEALGFERGLIVLKTPRGDTEHPVTRNVQRDETGAYKVSRTLINRALLAGERAIVNNPATDLTGPMSESLVRFPICSALCVPIVHRGEILGVIYGDRITQASSYQPADVDFLAAIAQQVGVGLANLRLFQEYLHAQRMRADLDQARAIQQGLLPQQPLDCGRVAIAGYNEASSAVSGDYYDYFMLEDGRIGLAIADVTGHGLPAALLMANLQSALRVALTAGSSLADLASRMNRLICANTSSSVFITAIIACLDPDSGVLEYVSAGHPSPLVISRSHCSVRDGENSLPLGVDPDEKYSVCRLVPEGVEAALLYTDGLTEAADPQGTILGIRPVIDGILSTPQRTPAALIRAARDTVRGHLGGFDSTDDMTLLAIQWRS